MRRFTERAGLRAAPAFYGKAKNAYHLARCGRQHLVCSWGPSILDYTHPQMVKTVQQAAERSLSFNCGERAGLKLADWWSTTAIPERSNCKLRSYGVHQVLGNHDYDSSGAWCDCATRLISSRAAPRSRGCTASGSGGYPGTAGFGWGIPQPPRDHRSITTWTLYVSVRKPRGQIAAIITEAAPCNMGVVTPRPVSTVACTRLLTRTVRSSF